jgi:hypothetical protein
MEPRRIGFLGFNQVNALDLIGPLEAFATAMSEDGAHPLYEVVTIGLEPIGFSAEATARELGISVFHL